MLELTYNELIEYAEKYQFYGRFEAVSFCMGYCGKLDKEHFNMIEQMYLDGIIRE